MQRQALVKSAQDRQGRKDGVIAGAPRDDDIRTRIERADERLGAHLRNDRPAAIDRLFCQRAVRTDTLKRLFRHTPLEFALVDFGVDDRHAEFHSIFARNFVHELYGLRERCVAAAGQCRADQERYSTCARRTQHERQVVAIGRERQERQAGAMVVRPRVGRAGVLADEMRTGGEPALKSFEVVAAAHRARRCQPDDFLHGRHALLPFAPRRQRR